jgi:hypothetical protein
MKPEREALDREAHQYVSSEHKMEAFRMQRDAALDRAEQAEAKLAHLHKQEMSNILRKMYLEMLVSFVRWIHTDEFGHVEPDSWLEEEQLSLLAERFLNKKEGNIK